MSFPTHFLSSAVMCHSSHQGSLSTHGSGRALSSNWRERQKTGGGGRPPPSLTCVLMRMAPMDGISK